MQWIWKDCRYAVDLEGLPSELCELEREHWFKKRIQRSRRFWRKVSENTDVLDFVWTCSKLMGFGTHFFWGGGGGGWYVLL
jgi:hypothetical protein